MVRYLKKLDHPVFRLRAWDLIIPRICGVTSSWGLSIHLLQRTDLTCYLWTNEGVKGLLSLDTNLNFFMDD
jgi:hypothetical protein